jgi:hypothetical protein
MAGTECMNLKWKKLEKKIGTLDFSSFILITAPTYHKLKKSEDFYKI